MLVNCYNGYMKTANKDLSITPQVKKHYQSFSTFTNPGLYKQNLVDDLPDDICEIGQLVRKNIIHRTTLAAGNIGTNADLRFGDMTKVPWWRQPEDDVLTTAAAMLAELYRRDERGFVIDRAEENKLVLTCRFVSILMASILKSKGIPARVRSGHASYFTKDRRTHDHWINQYWSDDENRWITIDVDGSLSLTKEKDIDPYDMPDGAFDFPAKSWLDIRHKRVDENYFVNAGGFNGAVTVAWALFYDFHSLMNSEIIYLHTPNMTFLSNFPKLTDKQRSELDELATLMLNPDTNFDKLTQIWETKKEFRLLSGGLL